MDIRTTMISMRKPWKQASSTMFALLLLSGALLTFAADTAQAAPFQDGDYTYTVIGVPSVATVVGYTGAGGSIVIPPTLGGYPTAHIGNDAFDYVATITSIAIPDSVVSIGLYAFQYCISLASVTMGSGVATIDGWAFDHCASLTSIELPDSLTVIGDSAFAYCINMSSATIGAGVTSIGMAAFYGCSDLTTMIFHGLTPPNYVGSYWIQATNPSIRGHAYAGSSFPLPGNSYYGLTMGATISAEPAAPGIPINLAAASRDAQISLTWQAPTSDGGSVITNYNVHRSLASGGDFVLVASPVSPSFMDTGLTNGQTYYYRVSAENAQGTSANSSEVFATPGQTAGVPPAPQGLDAIAGNAQIALDWSPPVNDGGASITSYSIYRGTTSGEVTLLITLDNVLTFVDNGLTNGQIYYYRVSANNSLGEGPQSSEVSAIPAASTPPSAPTALHVSAGDGQLSIAWALPSDSGSSAILGYKIFRGMTSTTQPYLTTVSALSYIDSGLINGQQYYYKVCAYNSVGDGELTDVIAGTPVEATSAPEGSSMYLLVGIGAIAIGAIVMVFILRKKKR